MFFTKQQVFQKQLICISKNTQYNIMFKSILQTTRCIIGAEANTQMCWSTHSEHYIMHKSMHKDAEALYLIFCITHERASAPWQSRLLQHRSMCTWYRKGIVNCGKINMSVFGIWQSEPQCWKTPGLNAGKGIVNLGKINMSVFEKSVCNLL